MMLLSLSVETLSGLPIHGLNGSIRESFRRLSLLAGAVITSSSAGKLTQPRQLSTPQLQGSCSLLLNLQQSPHVQSLLDHADGVPRLWRCMPASQMHRGRLAWALVVSHTCSRVSYDMVSNQGGWLLPCPAHAESLTQAALLARPDL